MTRFDRGETVEMMVMLHKDRKPMILAIDDDAIILNAVLSALRGRYDVRPFSSGKTALKFMNQTAMGEIDLILLDYHMPEMDGFEILDHLRTDERTREIPVVFLTAWSTGDSEVEALKRGASDFLDKPIKPSVLLMRVEHQLELQRYRKHLEHMVAEQTERLRSANEKLKNREEATLNLLARVTDMRDQYTGSHIERTTEFVRIIAEDLYENPHEGYELTDEQFHAIVMTSKLHDLGKIAVPDHILLKPGRLTDEEFEIIKRHPDHGAELLAEYVSQTEGDPFLYIAMEIARFHHEKWNGEGYPLGLAGEEIPLPARIAALADVYDALTSRRPYKKSLSHEESVEIIAKSSGVNFDPHIVALFLKHQERFREIAEAIPQ